MLVPTETMGVGISDVTEFAVADDGSREEAASDVCVGELSPPLPEARPEMDDRVGALLAWFLPMVAYAFPSWSLKKGRGWGDSWQQSTWVASALQHQLLLWLEHCVIDSPPTAFMS